MTGTATPTAAATDPPQPALRYSKILIAVTPDTDAATLADMAELATRHGADAIVFDCLESPTDRAALARVLGIAEPDLMDRMIADRRARLQAMVDRAGFAAAPDIVLRVGKPFIETIRLVQEAGVDLVVKTAEPLDGVQGFLFASTDHHLLRKCPCPVWLRRPGGGARMAEIIAAVDVDEWDASEPDTLHDLNLQVLHSAARLAHGHGARVHVLHAWDAVGEGAVWAFASDGAARVAADRYVNAVLEARRAALTKLIATFRSQVATDAVLVPDLVRGPADRVIADRVAAVAPDVLILGTVARTGVSGVIIGNTAEDILNRIDCAIVAVKPTSFRSPLKL